MHFLRRDLVAREVSLDGDLSLRMYFESTSQERELTSVGKENRIATHQMPWT
jgi:hypothetical protein